MTKKGGGKSDGRIIEEVLAGNVDAFEGLLERYREHVFRIVGRRVPAEDVPEVAQEVFVRAWSSLEGYRAKGPFRGWLTSIAVRACHDFWRRRYRSRELPLSSLSEEHEQWLKDTVSGGSSGSWEKSQSRMIARDIMMTALRRLSPKDRAVVELVHLEERPVREAAKLLGWSVANVKVRAMRARRKLRDIIRGLDVEMAGGDAPGG